MKGMLMALPEPDLDREIDLGEISILPFDDDSVWLRDNKTQEGMAVSKQKFEDLLVKYFRENM